MLLSAFKMETSFGSATATTPAEKISTTMELMLVSDRLKNVLLLIITGSLWLDIFVQILMIVCRNMKITKSGNNHHFLFVCKSLKETIL